MKNGIPFVQRDEVPEIRAFCANYWLWWVGQSNSEWNTIIYNLNIFNSSTACCLVRLDKKLFWALSKYFSGKGGSASLRKIGPYVCGDDDDDDNDTDDYDGCSRNVIITSCSTSFRQQDSVCRQYSPPWKKLVVIYPSTTTLLVRIHSTTYIHLCLLIALIFLLQYLRWMND